jgi:transcriptional regulator with XRE-family HTH domain
VSNETAGGVGERVATLRKLQGLTQHQLATKAHVSESLVKKVEQAYAPASPSFIASCARALGVEVTMLTGQPYEDLTTDVGAERAGIPLLRRALDAYDDPETDGPVWSAATLRAQLDEGEALHRDSHYAELAQRLPSLLHHLYAHAANAAEGQEREEAHALLDDGYSLAHEVARVFGHLDLAALATERLIAAAQHSGDPLRVAVAAFRRSHLQLYRGDYDLGMRTVDRAIDLAGEQRTPKGMAVMVQLHLRQAIFSARAGSPDQADAHIDEARELVNHGVPVSPYVDVIASPANVDIHSVAVPVELSDGTTAVGRAESIQLDTQQVGFRERAGHYYIDLARAWILHGRRESALQALQMARHISPQRTRYHPTVRETLHAVAAADRRSTDSLSGFAQWAGVTL